MRYCVCIASDREGLNLAIVDADSESDGIDKARQLFEAHYGVCWYSLKILKVNDFELFRIRNKRNILPDRRTNKNLLGQLCDAIGNWREKIQ